MVAVANLDWNKTIRPIVPLVVCACLHVRTCVWMRACVCTVHSLETGTLTFWCLSHIVVDIVKTTVHPALCDPCNYSLPHLRAEMSKNREIEIQPGFTKLGHVCHGKMCGEADPKPRFLKFKVGF